MAGPRDFDAETSRRAREEGDLDVLRMDSEILEGIMASADMRLATPDEAPSPEQVMGSILDFDEDRRREFLGFLYQSGNDAVRCKQLHGSLDRKIQMILQFAEQNRPAVSEMNPELDATVKAIIAIIMSNEV